MYKDPLEDMFGDEHDLEGLSQLLLFHMLSGTSLTFIMFNSSYQFPHYNYKFPNTIRTISTLFVYKITLHYNTGDKVSPNCRTLPRKNYMESSLLRYVHASNDTIRKKGKFVRGIAVLVHIYNVDPVWGISIFILQKTKHKD